MTVHNKQYFYVYGVHAVNHLLRCHPEQIIELWVIDKKPDSRLDSVIHNVRSADVEIRQVPRAQLDQAAGEARHQNILALCLAPKIRSEKELDHILETLSNSPTTSDTSAKSKKALFLVLDGVQDPHNLGACLRSADAAGVDAVIVPKDRAVGLTSTVIKVACGAAHWVPLIQVTNLARSLKLLQEYGVWLVGTDGDADQSLYDVDLTGPVAIVMGSEGKGMRQLTRKHCDYKVKLPMVGAVESLNVSVATGICLFEARRQRG